ncbi:hypothetical protein T12_1441, partial [Trichinella patagoniensis]
LRLFVNNRGNVFTNKTGRPGSDWKRCLQVASVCKQPWELVYKQSRAARQRLETLFTKPGGEAATGNVVYKLRLFVNNRGNVFTNKNGRPGSDWKRCLKIASGCKQPWERVYKQSRAARQRLETLFTSCVCL